MGACWQVMGGSSMGMGIHTCGMYTRARDAYGHGIWLHGCMRLSYSRILMYMHRCNGPGWHMSKLHKILIPISVGGKLAWK